VPYSATFNATTDWAGPAGGYYSITFNHLLNSVILGVELWDNTSTQTQVFVDHVNVDDANNVTIYVTEAPDGRFAGRIVIFNQATIGATGATGPTGPTSAGSIGLMIVISKGAYSR
jgi:hypothetical protein